MILLEKIKVDRYVKWVNMVSVIKCCKPLFLTTNTCYFCPSDQRLVRQPSVYKTISIEKTLKTSQMLGFHPLDHKHVKMSVGKWIMEETYPHKHGCISGNPMFFASLCLV